MPLLPDSQHLTEFKKNYILTVLKPQVCLFILCDLSFPSLQKHKLCNCLIHEAHKSTKNQCQKQ